MKVASAALLVACLHSDAFAQVVTLTLPDSSAARFEQGAVVRLPRVNRNSRIEVRLPAALVRADLYLDEMRLATRSYSESDGSLVFVADAVEPAGLLAGDEQVLQAVRFVSTREIVGEWRIRRWDAPYVEASRSTQGGRAPDVRIDEPAGAAFVFLTRPSSVTVKGSVLTQGSVLLKVAGTEIKIASEGGDAGFAIEMTLPAEQKEIEVYAQDRGNGATRQVVLPIITARRSQ